MQKQHALTLPYLNIGDLKRIAVTLPSPKQQQAIACILGTLDDKIELNRFALLNQKSIKKNLTT